MSAFFQSLYESDLTRRLGLSLAHALWQGCAVALLLGLMLQVMRHASAGARHAVACAALLLLLAAPVVTFFRLDRPLPAIMDARPETITSVTMEEPPHQVPIARPIDLDVASARGQGLMFKEKAASSAPFPWHVWAVMAWLGGMLVLTIWHGVGWLQLQRLRRQGVIPWCGDLAEMARRMATRLRLRFMPRVLWSARISGPVAFGCWRTVVLLPASMASGFTTRQIEMILAHEFAHLRRHDYLINLCQTAATTMLFFHPAMWWINRVIHREREHACDDMAVAAVGDAAGYARTLLSLAEQELTGAPALAAATVEKKGMLRHRIERLLLPPPSRLGTRLWPGVVMLLLAALTWQTLLAPNTVAQTSPANAAPVRGDIRDRNGVVLATHDAKKGRSYPFAAMASHVLGYANTTSSGKPEEKAGGSGVERLADELLRPVAQEKVVARRGADVYLTLDARYQAIVERTLRQSRPRIARGAVVLLEVNTGDVLAMVSAPSFDPNDFVPAISKEKFEAYGNDATHPLLNRSVRGFVPGSTFKLATSLAAICTGHENDRCTCAGGATYGSRYMQCWIGQKGGAHGDLGLREAMVLSCGPYFYQLGNAVGNDALNRIASLCGLGRTSGILPEETAGIMPFQAWWKTNRPRESFTDATLANNAIGQGAMLATPLQLASLAATIANGGTVWKPRLVDRIAPQGDASKSEAQPHVRLADLRTEGLTASGLDKLRGAMEDVVHSEEGTGRMARSAVIRIAGKTGTAQNWRMEEGKAVRDNHTWFVCYAPAEKPKWAMAALVQGGKGGGVSAAPLARHMLEQISAVEGGMLKIELGAMAPIEGNFDVVEQVEVPMRAKE